MHGLSHCCCCCAIAGSYRSAEVTLPLLMNLLHIKMYHEIFRLTSCNTPQLVLRTWLPLTRNLLLFPSQHYGNVDELQPGCVACLLILLASLNTRTLTYFIYIYIWNGVCAHIIEQINLIANLGCCFLCMYDMMHELLPCHRLAAQEIERAIATSFCSYVKCDGEFNWALQPSNQHMMWCFVVV